MTGSSSDLEPFPPHGHFQEIPAFSLGEGWVLEQLPGCRQEPWGSPGWAPPWDQHLPCWSPNHKFQSPCSRVTE